MNNGHKAAGRDGGESNQLLGCNGGRDWAVPELPGSRLEVWIDWQCLLEIDGAPIWLEIRQCVHISSSRQSGSPWE